MRLLATDSPERFARVGARFLGVIDRGEQRSRPSIFRYFHNTVTLGAPTRGRAGREQREGLDERTIRSRARSRRHADAITGSRTRLSGQLHFRACGAGPDIVLLPWLPASGRMYEHVMPHLARAGFRAIAFDLAGSGRSHKKCRNWTVQQYAADVLEACGSLHTVPYTVVGGRFSRRRWPWRCC